jgi:hypothetical protein
LLKSYAAEESSKRTEKGVKAPYTPGALLIRWGVALQIGEAKTGGTTSLDVCLLHPIRRRPEGKVVLFRTFFGKY